LIVSFADRDQGHTGIIYQAGNWIYAGQTSKSKEYWYKGRKFHSRQISEKGWNIQQGVIRKTIKPSQCIVKNTLPKHRYLMPLNKSMRKKIQHFKKPYPKADEVKPVTRNAPSVERVVQLQPIRSNF
tara:strand:+ start:246 stop:626 length:381 start_codon:yes stop_codon:yes gene_type:complete